jgi:hypothetical protein
VSDIDDLEEIRRLTRRTLERADVWGTIPTPVEPVLRAAGLTEPKVSLLGQLGDLAKRLPRHLRRGLQAATSQVLALIDFPTNEVHVHPSVDYEPQRRWYEFHEAGHKIPDWQREVLMYLDDRETLTHGTKRLFEKQANHFASELAFQLDHFTDDTSQNAIGLVGLIGAAQAYNMGIRASLRRYVEGHRSALCAIAMPTSPLSIEPLRFQRLEVPTSRSFRERFGTGWQFFPKLLGVDRFDFLFQARASQAQLRIPFRGHWTCLDLNRDLVRLTFDLYNTGHNILALFWIPERGGRRSKRFVLHLPDGSEYRPERSN